MIVTLRLVSLRTSNEVIIMKGTILNYNGLILCGVVLRFERTSGDYLCPIKYLPL